MFIDKQTPVLPFWQLPDSLMLRGDGTERCCPIRTAFGVGIYVRSLFSEPYYLAHPPLLTATARRLLFSSPKEAEGLPDDAVLEAIVWYLADGRLSRSKVKKRLFGTSCPMTEEGEAARLFSYKWDMPALWASFVAEYRIDLTQPPHRDMHLWQFDALFRALPPESAVGRLSSLRALDPASIADADLRAEAAAEKHRVRIPAEAELNEMYNDTHMCEGRFFV